MIPSEVSAKPVIQLLLRKSFLWFEIQFFSPSTIQETMKSYGQYFLFICNLNGNLAENRSNFEAIFDQSSERFIE